MPGRRKVFATAPDPGQAGSLDELVERLRLLKVWAGDPSYEWIRRRVNATWQALGRPAVESVGKTTVVDCFRSGRQRLNADLVLAVVRTLHPDDLYVAQWRQALQVIGGQAHAASQVRVRSDLPPDLVAFTGRTAEVDRLRRARQRAGRAGDAVVISAIEGMAGVGKTRLAIHAGHVLAREKPFDVVLFVNLRGFHPDPAQPPADPAAVLDGFLRLLGMPGHRIPHDVAARVVAYRKRLAGTQALIILDNAADEDQVGPLLPDTPGCLTLVTSRRSLTGMRAAMHVTLDVFTSDEALQHLARTTADVPLGTDPDAPARIARRCGHLPLALELVAGHVRARPDWTLTDQADRLDERHERRRLDTGVELALGVSYQNLHAGQRSLLRMVALHPGPDIDAYGVAALTGGELSSARSALEGLRRDHLLEPAGAGRYTLHDLVRSYAAGLSSDEDPRADRRAALTRLFDYYLATAAAAMEAAYPADSHRRPSIPRPATPMPAVADPDDARTWLDIERPNLVAVAAYTSTNGWATHTSHLSATLFRYFNGGHHLDALAVHSHALNAARGAGDSRAEAQAWTNLGVIHVILGRHELAAEHFQRALPIFRRSGDTVGQARALGNLGAIEERLGQYRQAAEYHEQAAALYREASDRTGEAAALSNLGIVEGRLGRHRQAIDHQERALAVFRQLGDRVGEAITLGNLGELNVRLGRRAASDRNLRQSLTLFEEVGDRPGEAWTLDVLGTLHTSLGQPAEASACHHRALTIFRETGVRDGEAWALNGLGEAARTAGRAADAITHHDSARTVAVEVGDRYQQARAHAGLGHAHRALGHPDHAGRHYRQALELYAHLGTPEADEIRSHLAAAGSCGDG